VLVALSLYPWCDLTLGISNGLIEFITRRVYTFLGPLRSQQLTAVRQKIWGYTTLLFLFSFPEILFFQFAPKSRKNYTGTESSHTRLFSRARSTSLVSLLVGNQNCRADCICEIPAKDAHGNLGLDFVRQLFAEVYLCNCATSLEK
jgi:hypothetical protein